MPTHKKSQSMVQNKITHLLSKGAKTNKIQNTQANINEDSKALLEKAEQQHHAQAQLNEILNRSMDNVNQINTQKRPINAQQHHQGFNNDETELMRVLLDQKGLKELSYQNQQEYTAGSREGESNSFHQFLGKHTRAATHGTNTLIHCADESNLQQQSATYHIQSQSKKVRPPSHKVQKHDLTNSHNQSALTSQVKPGHKVNNDKIASSGKVYASGAVVKKPTNKNMVSIQAQQAIGNSSQQIPLQQPSHHRIKSDQHYSQKSKELIGQNTVLQQKGKVGKILKDNFVDSSLQIQYHQPQSSIQYDQNQSNLTGQGRGVAHSSFGQSNQPSQSKQITNRTFQQPPSQVVQTQPNLAPSQNQQLLAQLIQGSGGQTKHKTQHSQQQQQHSQQVQATHRKKLSTKDAKPTKSNSSGGGTTNQSLQQSQQPLDKNQQMELQELYTKLLKKHAHVKGNPEPLVIQPQPEQMKPGHKRSANTKQSVVQQMNVLAQLQNRGDLQKRIEQNENRGSSWDGKISGSNSALTLQQSEVQTKVPPQSSTSSLRTNQIVGYQQPKTQSKKSQEPPISNSKFIVAQTQIAQHKQNKESIDRFTPIQSAKGRQKVDDKLQSTHTKSMTMRESGSKKNHQQVRQQTAAQQQEEQNPRRSLSNGSNDSARFKFNKSVNSGMPQLQQAQQPTIVSKTAHISRQSLSSRDASQGKQRSQYQAYQQQSPQQQEHFSPTVQQINQQKQQQRKGLKMKSKSNASHALREHSLCQNIPQQTLSTNQSPRFQYTENGAHQEQELLMQQTPPEVVNSFQYQKLNLGQNKVQHQVVNRVETQPMVILENTPPDSATPIQLSEWDRMIKQQFKKQEQQTQHPQNQNPTMVNNLVGQNDRRNVSNISYQGQPSQTQEKQRDSQQSKQGMGSAPGTHQKNKLSAHSENIPSKHLIQGSQSQIKAIQQAESQHQSSRANTDQPSMCAKSKHKRVKSDIPVQTQKNMIVMNNYIGGGSSANEQVHEDDSKLKYKQQQKMPGNFIRNRLEANPLNDQKQLNISVEQLIFEEEDNISNQKGAKFSDHQSSQRQKKGLKEAVPVKKVQKIVVGPHQRLKSDVVQQAHPPLLHEPDHKPVKKLQQSEIQRQVRKVENRKSQQAKEIFAAPQNSVCQSTGASPDRGMLPKQQNDWRIETQESIDSSCSPRERQHKKLVSHIKKHFAQHNECPPTTVDFYRVGKVLGKGAFGKVNIALQVVAKQLVAIKSINTSHFKDDKQSQKVMQEVLILKQTRHPNIVRLYEFFQTQKHVLIVIELSSGGDLLSYVRKRRQLKEDVAKSVFKQIISAIQYCHSKNILHRDIKLDNILLTVEGGVKLCDFGVSKQVKPGERMNEQCGTPAYIAPEILADKGYEGFAIDIWSVGVVLYAMLYGTVPFKAPNMTELQKMIIKASYTLADGISKEARDLLKNLLEKDPLQRLTIQGILQHPWMRDAQETVDLFTPAEKNYMVSQILASQDQQKQVDPNSGDVFSDQMLETHENSLKNAETKSIILAPFNSTRSNLKEIEKHYSLPGEIKELIQSKACLKFNNRAVREIDKQYEVNNNELLDNGVYHDFNVEKEDSLQSDFHKSAEDANKKDSDNQQLQQLQKMIKQQQENNQVSEVAKVEQNYLEQQKEDIGKLAPSVALSSLDEEIVDQAEGLGYNAAILRSYLHNQELNNATATYYLLQSKKQSNLVDTTTQKKGED